MNRSLSVCSSLILAGCCAFNPSKCEDSEDAFVSLRRCASSRIQPSDQILYFGPTNLPIGTIYEKVSSGFDPSWRGTAITGEKPDSSIVEPPSYGSCTYKGKSSIDLKAAFGVNLDPIPVGGELSTDFKNAKVIDMTADQFGWETLYKGPYRELIKKNTNIYDDISKRQTAAAIALLKVKGYKVTLQVSNQDAVGLKAKYKNGPLPKGLTGDISADVGIQWTSDNTLALLIRDETAVAGVMREFDKGQLQSASGNESVFGANVAGDRQTVRLRK